jgi:glutaredoxin
VTQHNDEEIRRELELETGQIDSNWRPLVGSGLLCLATLAGFVSAIADPPPPPFDSPVLRGYVLLGALALTVLAVILLRQPRAARDPLWQPQQAGLRFDSVVLYTRSACHLCHQARETLLMHHEFLSQISEVDIDGDPELVKQYGECVPVVMIDGRERFRGQIDVLLLRRLIDATAPRVRTT